jgi:NADH:ubiquinone oxidoreductase subunit H
MHLADALWIGIGVVVLAMGAILLFFRAAVHLRVPRMRCGELIAEGWLYEW